MYSENGVKTVYVKVKNISSNYPNGMKRNHATGLNS